MISKNLMNHYYLKNITHADDAPAKKVCQDFEIKNLGEDHDLYVQSNTLLLADVFEHFRNMCLEMYEIDTAKFISAAGLAWQSDLKRLK